MCKRIFTKRTPVLLLTAALACGTVYAQYTQSPPSCNGTGGSVGISVFHCADSTVASCTTPFSGAGTVIVGEHIAYRVTIGPQAGTCAFALGTSGTFNLTLPNASVVNLASDTGTCTTLGGPVACTPLSNASTGACIGCTVAQTGGVGNFPILTSAYTSPMHIYQVALADVSGGFIVASTAWGGTGTRGNDIAFTQATTPTAGPQLGTSLPSPVVSCSASIDKQVSCNGGASWQDVTATDDPSAASPLGCLQASGGTVNFQYIATNTGGAAISCTLSDDKIILAAGQTAVSLPATLSSTTTKTSSTACNLTGTDVDNNTATLGSCTCTSAGGETITGTGGTDTANYACTSVKIDKQVSCDGGVTWADAATTAGGLQLVSNNLGGTNGCIGALGADIQVRWYGQATGNVPLTCTLVETNTNLQASDLTGQTIGTATPVSPISSTGVLDCMTAHGGLPGLEPDTATLNCTPTLPTGISNPLNLAPTANDLATFQCCGVTVDKQVSCNGGAFTDVGQETANGGGTTSCSAVNGQTVAVRYYIQNTGTLGLACSGTSALDGTNLQLTDIFVAGGVTDFTATASVAAGTTSSAITNTNITQCSSTLSSNESQGDKGSVLCECAGSAALGSAVDVSAFDIAQIQCANGPTPWTASKTCTPTAGLAAGNFNTDVKVTDLSTTTGLSCTAVDMFVSGTCSGTTPPACPITVGSPATLAPASLSVAANTSSDFTGTLISTATVCNQACVTCAPASTPCTTAANCPAVSGTTAACVAGACQYTTTSAVEATCPVGSCFTRTPGYWGTHPCVTQQLLPLTSCGIILSTTNAFTSSSPAEQGPLFSATEDLCENGQDAKSAGTSPQQLQLIRQCTAAALNMAASGSGDFAAGLASCDGADPGIAATFGTCCSTLCDSGASKAAINASSCISLLDAFNNAYETTQAPANLNLACGGKDGTGMGAQPGQCQIAGGNGVVNSRDLGPAK